jgi:hypothetical protein
VSNDNVISFSDRHFVRFFTEPVECDWCEQETHGYVFEKMQSIICSKCRSPLLVIEDKPTFVLTLEPDDDDS